MNYRIIIFVLTFILGVVFSIPTIFQKDYAPKISLGLDLQGGIHMLLGVKTKKAIESRVKSLASSIRHFANKEKYLIDKIDINNNGFDIVMYDEVEATHIKKYLSDIKGLVIKQEYLSLSIYYSKKEQEAIKDYAINQAVDVIRNRLDQFGLAEPYVSKQGKDKILIELPGIKTPEQEKQARELISKPANLELMVVDERHISKVYKMSDREAQSYGDIILKDTNNDDKLYLVKEIPILDGSKLVDASVSFDQQNQVVISFKLDSEGASIFGDFTANNIGKRLAVVLDDKVYSAPNIRERIGGGSGQISGSFTPDEATSLAIALRSGSLLAPVYLLEKRSVGPSLGKDSVNASLLALIGGFVLVMLFMIMYYGISGVVSVVALITNLVVLISIMSFFGATLTLPGMAGIVLTIGMAVDANVIINERIREFLVEIKSSAKAIELGYKNGVRAILDANITTLLIAIILYAYGTGTIKGFAVTMSIGIIASMLTAIVCTHGIYIMYSKSINKNKKLWFGISSNSKKGGSL
jgi:preprotein translocase subunit SecD